MIAKRTLLIMSNKGGVGKTTVAVNLAYALSKKGFHVGLLDIDIHGPNVPKMLNLEGTRPSSRDNRLIPVRFNENLKVMSMGFLLEKADPAVWRGPMKHGIISQFLNDVEWGELDYLIIDCPPGTGDESISAIQLLKGITGAIIVSTPQEVALADAARAVNFSKKMNLRVLGLIENMSGEVFGEGGVEEAAGREKIPFLGRLGLSAQIRDAGDRGAPFATNGSFDAIAKKVEDACSGAAP